MPSPSHAPDNGATFGVGATADRIFAIEGPSLSGKTTLINRILDLRPDVLPFECYVEALGGADIPDFNPGSTKAQVEAFQLFAAIDASRTSAIAALSDDATVLLDRSVDSLLAHSYALDRLFGYSSHESVRKLVAGLPVTVPEVTFYMEASAPLLRSRFPSRKGTLPSDFIGEEFVAAFHEYFAKGMSLSPSIVFVDADSNVDRLPPEVLDRLVK